jgi:hypothetical protein
MSLDVYLYGKETLVKCQCQCGHSHFKKERPLLFDYNITHNLNKMAAEAGLYEALWRPEEIGAQQAKDIIGKLGVGLDVLKHSPDEFKKFNPINGWGKYENLVSFVEKYLEACIENPESDISVSR